MVRGRKKFHIGTSGWNYNHWRNFFYPEDMSSKKWFDYYAERFQTVEINNTFYNLPQKKTFDNWYRMAPDNFVFSVKASRFITHMKKLKDPAQSLKKFIERTRNLKDKLGPILFQLPPRWKFNAERLKEFLEELPQEFRYTFEFRDKSWWNDRALELLNKYKAAFCIFELEGERTPKEVTADFVYIRMHGPGGAYQGSYDNRELAGWAGAISAWNRQKKDVYIYFDNDENAYAAHNALALKRMLEK
jgi:uncharacterized protein YecE (DUF72 family)